MNNLLNNINAVRKSVELTRKTTWFAELTYRELKARSELIESLPRFDATVGECRKDIRRSECCF